MYAKLINDKLQFAPYYLADDNKTILNPQSNDYKSAGYKIVEYSPKPRTIEYGALRKTYSQDADKITVQYIFEEIEITPIE